MVVKKFFSLLLVFVLALFIVGEALAQDYLPRDNGLATYHTWPRYRESESHPLRIGAYIVHPFGWLTREVITRPLSYIAGSSRTTRSVFGYREPYDYREPECFSSDDSVPDCRAVVPFNYEVGSDISQFNPGGANMMGPAHGTGDVSAMNQPVRQVYFPDVNFDFDVRKLNTLGQGKSKQVAALLQKAPGVTIVLEGHTDQLGTEKYNEKLGMDRSEAVRAELLKLGVPADRVSTVTFGKTRPIFTDTDPASRAVNRRVEVHVDAQ